MKKFIVIYYAQASAVEQMAKASPEEMKKGMEAWMEWAKKVGSGMVDMGTPLGNGQKVTKSGATASNSTANIRIFIKEFSFGGKFIMKFSLKAEEIKAV